MATGGIVRTVKGEVADEQEVSPMNAVIVYESMYGNTHLIAQAIGDGLQEAGEETDVVVVPVGKADAVLATEADLLVVGAPTHVHGMSRPRTRTAAVEAASKTASGLTLEPEAEGPGVREWLDSLGNLDVRAAAFDTRIDAPAALTGRASKRIAHKLRQHRCTLIADPESFLVTKESHLEPDQATRARQWGASLAAQVTGAPSGNEVGDLGGRGR